MKTFWIIADLTDKPVALVCEECDAGRVLDQADASEGGAQLIHSTDVTNLRTSLRQCLPCGTEVR